MCHNYPEELIIPEALKFHEQINVYCFNWKNLGKNYYVKIGSISMIVDQSKCE